jgi:hypothetical protein
MTLLRATPLLLLAALATAAVADDKVDPAKLKDKVTITPGKKLLVQFNQEGDALSRPKTVAKPSEKPPTVSFEFLKQGDMLILATKNPFPKPLKFRALARLEGRKDYFETSIVPVRAGLSSFELWQDPIEELVLFDFKLSDEKPEAGKD